MVSAFRPLSRPQISLIGRNIQPSKMTERVRSHTASLMPPLPPTYIHVGGSNPTASLSQVGSWAADQGSDLLRETVQDVAGGPALSRYRLQIASVSVKP